MQDRIKNTEQGRHISKYNEYWSQKKISIIIYGILNIWKTKTQAKHYAQVNGVNTMVLELLVKNKCKKL